MHLKHVYITLIALLLVVVGAHSQETHTEISVDFRVNSTVIEKDFSDNSARLTQIINFLRDVENDSTITMLEVSFCGSASPEGSHQLNQNLAHKRLEALENLVRSEVDIPEEIITRDDEHISWDTLREFVVNSDIEQKQAILDIIDQEARLIDYPGKRHIDHRVVQLQNLGDGKPWQQLNNLYFARMRNACVIFITYKQEPKPVEKPAPVEVVEEVIEVEEVVDTVVAAVPDTIVIDDSWTRKLHLKTNTLGWALAISNIAAEIDLAEHWSFTLPVYFSALNYFTSTIKFRTFALQPEMRYWLNEENEGWFGGAHFGMAYYNLALDGDIRYQDHDGKSPALGGGISIGYRKPITSDNRWHIEFTLGAGVYRLHYDKFYNTPNTSAGLMIETVKKTYWGLDNAAVTFTYSFDLNKKGGKR
ncbi:MAG: DUF3575 domain-containing protein [Muribaculaceae bacterium]|nr:DUF3575 domain-containing protein [Muribaculaceae bacterium]